MHQLQLQDIQEHIKNTDWCKHCIKQDFASHDVTLWSMEREKFQHKKDHEILNADFACRP